MKKLRVGKPAPPGVVLDAEEREVALAELWPQRPTFLTFLRHFG